MAAKNNDWMGMMEEWFGKLPSLPKGGREAIVTITPWIALIFGVLGVLAGLAGLGLLTALSPFAAMGGGIGTTTWSWASALVGIVASALLLASFPGTKARKKKGWMMLLYFSSDDIINPHEINNWSWQPWQGISKDSP